MKSRFHISPIAFIAFPPLIGVIASIWPLERVLLSMICFPLLIVSITGVIASRSLRHRLLHVAAVALILATVTHNAPLQAAFSFFRPTFDNVADQIESGTDVRTPLWIGPIRVCKAERYRNGVICIWTDDTPGGHTGFVRHSPSKLPFNLWSHFVMDDAWQFIAED